MRLWWLFLWAGKAVNKSPVLNVRQRCGANQKGKAVPSPAKGHGEAGWNATEGRPTSSGKKTGRVSSMLKDWRVSEDCWTASAAAVHPQRQLMNTKCSSILLIWRLWKQIGAPAWASSHRHAAPVKTDDPSSPTKTGDMIIQRVHAQL